MKQKNDVCVCTRYTVTIIIGSYSIFFYYPNKTQSLCSLCFGLACKSVSSFYSILGWILSQIRF